VTGDRRGLVHPMLVVNLVNGQTTYASQHVKGNLFYRGLLLQQPVFVGDTLFTTTRVVGLKQNKAKAGRDATGMVALEMETQNQDGACVLKYWRCPMIPCRDPHAATGHDDDFDWIPERLDLATLLGAVPLSWNISALDPASFKVPAPALAAGDRVVIEAQDTITCAPELVRLTGNIAFAHTDASRSYLGKRLVYGGHTISIALAQVARALPNIVTMVGWQGCDHPQCIHRRFARRTQPRWRALRTHRRDVGAALRRRWRCRRQSCAGLAPGPVERLTPATPYPRIVVL